MARRPQQRSYTDAVEVTARMRFCSASVPADRLNQCVIEQYFGYKNVNARAQASDRTRSELDTKALAVQQHPVFGRSLALLKPANPAVLTYIHYHR